MRVSTDEDNYQGLRTPPGSPGAGSLDGADTKSLSRCHSLKSPKRKDLRSTAIIRSASGTKLSSMDDQTGPEDQDGSKMLSRTPPGVPVATLAIRRDSFNMNQGKSRSVNCLLTAAASAAEIAGQPVLVSHARTRSYLCGSVGPTSMLGN